MSRPNQKQDLQFEKKNQDMVKLPKYARVQKRPIPHAPVASPYAGSSVPKIVYVSTNSPFMSAVKRVQKLLRQAEKRATASLDLANSKKRDHQKLATIARGQDELRREAVFVKATGRAIQKALGVGRWFEERETEYAVRVKTGSVLVVDDIVEDEEAKRKAIEAAGRLREELEGGQKQQPEQADETTILSGTNDGSGTIGDSMLSTEVSTKPLSKSALKKRKRAANSVAAMADAELPESRTRWVNTVEVAITFK